MSDLIKSIGFDNVCFGYEEGRFLIEKSSFEFPLNNISVVHGSPSSGKSTVLKILGALLRPDGGSYKINGFDAMEMSFEEFLSIRKKIGFSHEMGGLMSNKSMIENLMLPLEYHNICSPKECIKRVGKMIDMFDLGAVTHLMPSSVSGRMRKAAVVARSFLLEPELLLLDEPTVGLSSKHSHRLSDHIKDQFAKGAIKHVFIVSEDQYFLREVVNEEIYFENKTLSQSEEKLESKKEVS